jgi:hypothetical protein
MLLQNGLQVVLQTTRGTDYDCEGFIGLAVADPCQIVIACDGSTAALATARRLGASLRAEILRLGPGAGSGRMPCRSTISDPGSCHAYGVTECLKVMAYVLQNPRAKSLRPDVDMWVRDGHTVVPVAPQGTNLAAVLPRPLAQHNAALWANDVAEVLPVILAHARLTSEESALFVSYRRDDATALADQLFHRLSEDGFDVYLDRFRGTPGRDFVVQLTEALADKAFVLVIESPNILMSSWTLREVDFAKSHQLGIMSLQMPGGQQLPSIDPGRRYAPPASDFSGTGRSMTLASARLEALAARVKLEHGRALAERRRYLRDTMRDAMLLEGVTCANVLPGGLLHAPHPAGSHTGYAVLLTPRPPTLADFHTTHTRRPGGSVGIVVGPQLNLPSQRQARVQWLAGVSSLQAVDESRIACIARGL